MSQRFRVAATHLRQRTLLSRVRFHMLPVPDSRKPKAMFPTRSPCLRLWRRASRVRSVLELLSITYESVVLPFYGD